MTTARLYPGGFSRGFIYQMACLFSSSSGHQFLPDVLEGAECLAHSSSILWSLPCQSLWTASVLMLLPTYPSIFIHLRDRDLDCFSFHVSFPIILTNANSYFTLISLLFCSEFSPHSFVLSNHDLPVYHSRIFSLTHFLEISLMWSSCWSKTPLFCDAPCVISQFAPAVWLSLSFFPC